MTGVQTCALPIYQVPHLVHRFGGGVRAFANLADEAHADHVTVGFFRHLDHVRVDGDHIGRLGGTGALFDVLIGVVELLVQVLGKQLPLRGFLVGPHYDLFDPFAQEVGGWIASGELKFDETVVDGIDQTPAAFMGLLQGQNTGKMIVKL